VLNFVEAGFRVGVAPREEIVVLAYVTKLYTATAKDRKSITMIETIIANGIVIPPLMIIQGKQHMENWYSTKLEKDVRVVLSDSRYTNKEISLILLDHIALHTNAGLDKRSKVLLMDQHGSYMDPDFTIKAISYCGGIEWMCRRSARLSGQWNRSAYRLKAQETDQQWEWRQTSMRSPKHTKCMSVAPNGSGQHYNECR
jgi:primosomal protein N'